MAKDFDRIYREERGSLLRFIRSKVSDSFVSEDILHDVFVKAAENANTMEFIDNITGWLYTVARNRIVDYYRRHKSRKFSQVSLNADIEDYGSLESLISDAGIDIEKEYIRRQVSDEIVKALELIPDSQREIFILQAVDGISFKEISELTGIPVNTLLSRKRYAVKALRKRLLRIKEMINENGMEEI